MPVHANPSLIESTERLLLQGGDARIALDPAHCLNKYLCRPVPDGGVAAFGSSTASTISPHAFAAADRLRRRLQARAAMVAPAELYASELRRIRAELAALCGLDRLDGLGVAFAASGTDVHLLAAQLAAGDDAAPTLAIMMGGSETGSGVPAALRGEHFSDRSALGMVVPEGAPLARRHALSVATVPLRQADGVPRPLQAIDQEVELLALRALRAGQRVLLIAADLSKTGMLAPGTACLLDLRNYAPDRIDLLVDACQFRIAPATVKAYLEAGCMVALTGSKFLTGPPFSGALLIPQAPAARLRHCRLPRALAAYSVKADWPARWSAADALDDGANFGLLLRWEAALAELRAFRQIPDDQIDMVLNAFVGAVHARLANDPAFRPLPVPALDRGALGAATGWDRTQTIFPFALCRPAARGAALPLSGAETRQVYRLLYGDSTEAGAAGGGRGGLRYLLGQPVQCGGSAALRLCASARMVGAACAGGRARPEAAIENALAALDKAAWLCSRASAGRGRVVVTA